MVGEAVLIDSRLFVGARLLRQKEEVLGHGNVISVDVRIEGTGAAVCFISFVL